MAPADSDFTIEHDTKSGTVFGHNMAAGAIATGAAPYYNTSTLEEFSSAGGSPILFTATGDRLPGGGVVRQKPEITALTKLTRPFSVILTVMAMVFLIFAEPRRPRPMPQP